jgi:hypothetical protein
MYTGPHLTKKDLAFGYDTGYGVATNNTPTRFYPGENTTNFVTTNLETLSPDGSGQSSVGTRTTIAPNHVRIVDVASNTRQSHLIYGLTASTIYTVSIQFKKITGTPTFRFQLQGYSGSSYVNTIKFTSTAETGLEDIEGWQTAEWTFTLPSNCNALRIWWQDGADYTTYTHSFELKNPQLEAKSHVTPYVSGTRSSTASLIDLKRTTNIDVSNMSFDSTGQPEFDGTDDVINTGMFTSRNPTYEPLTIEAIVKSDTTANARMWLDATSNGTNQRLYCALPYAGSSSPMGVQASGWSISTPQNTDFHHIVITMNGTTCQLYLDGVAHSSKAYTSYGLQSINIGGRNGYRWIGKIPVVKMHNKALTASEIKNNFNAYKNRFNI